MKTITYIRVTMVSYLVSMFLLTLWLGCAMAADPSPVPTPAEALSLWAFIKANWSQIGGAIFTLLFFVSEYMGQNPNIKSNGIFDFIQKWLKAKAGGA